MSLAQVLEELPHFSVGDRQEVLRSVLELDDAGLSPDEMELIETRLEAYRANPDSAVPLEEMAARLRSKFVS
jgi:putative addiction module component (TIGR02574 family)